MACLQHYRAQLGVEGVFAWGIALQTSPSTTTEVDLCVNRLHALGTYIPTSSRDGQVCIGVQSCPRTHNNSELLHLCSKVSAPAFQRDCPSMQVCVVSDSALVVAPAASAGPETGSIVLLTALLLTFCIGACPQLSLCTVS